MSVPLSDPPVTGATVPPVNGCFLDRLVLIAADRGLAGARDDLAARHHIVGDGFPLATVLAVADALGLRARHARLAWDDLAQAAPALPALLIFRDGATAILDGLEPAAPPAGQGPDRVLLRNEGPPEARAEEHLALDRDDLALFWAGDIILPA
jgi:hypothetical protein